MQVISGQTARGPRASENGWVDRRDSATSILPGWVAKVAQQARRPAPTVSEPPCWWALLSRWWGRPSHGWRKTRTDATPEESRLGRVPWPDALEHASARCLLHRRAHQLCSGFGILGGSQDAMTLRAWLGRGRAGGPALARSLTGGLQGRPDTAVSHVT